MANGPIKKFIAGMISVSIFQNEAKGRNGQSVTFRSTVLQRRYKDRNGEWQNAPSLRVNDLPKAALLLNKAYDFLVVRQVETSAAEEETAEEGEIIEEVI